MSASFAAQIVPLALIAARARDAIAKAEEEKLGDEATRAAFITTMTTLHFLQANHGLTLANAQVGFIKDTKEYGNTSISMGVAKAFFAKNADKDRVLIFNCGTGPAKAQLYGRDPATGLQWLVCEEKPVSGFSINSVATANFNPKGPISTNDALIALGDWIRIMTASGMISSLTTLIGLVTGKIREHYYDSPYAIQSEMDAAMCAIFGQLGVRPIDGQMSYFIEQDTEGGLEFTGTKTMYANLAQAGLLPTGTEVIVSMGIGRGSTQWTSEDTSNGTTHVLGFNKGMNDVAELPGFSDVLMRRLAMKDAHNVNLVCSADSTTRPVIALKSGCMLLLDGKANVQFFNWLICPESLEVTVHTAAPVEAKVPEPATEIVMSVEDRLTRIENAVMKLFDHCQAMNGSITMIGQRVVTLEESRASSITDRLASIDDALKIFPRA